MTMPPTILFRSDGSRDFEEEMRVAGRYMPLVTQRTKAPGDSIIVGRYSVLPFYRELEADLATVNSRLVNSYQQHQWIANFDWYHDLQEFTPVTWFDDNFHEAPEGAFVVKGRTNSRKYSWNTHMYAADKAAAIEVASRLANDSMIGEQGMVYRRFHCLETLEVGLNGLPFSNEWRVFCYGNEILDFGFYWSSAEKKLDCPGPGMFEFAQKVADVACQHANFYVLDVAKTEDGRWILIEVNDGQMSGLSECDPDTLYSNLVAAME